MNDSPARMTVTPEQFTITLEDFTEVEAKLESQYEKVEKLFRDITKSNYASRFCSEVHELVRKAAAEDICVLNEDDSDDENEDSSKEQKLTLFKTLGSSPWTQGYVGVLKLDIPPDKTPDNCPKQLTLNIRSRFDSTDRSYFLMYVFEQTMGSRGKLFSEMQLEASEVDIWDLLLMTSFLNQLHDAMKKGIFRQYRDREHNDERIGGRLDIARHLRENIPFMGKVAYSSREYAVDNPMNVLILRALHHFDRRYHSLLQRLINRDPVVRQGIQLLKNEAPDWQRVTDYTAMINTRRKVAHAVYKAYEPLRKTSIAVLKQLGASSFRALDESDTTEQKYRVSGILIEMPKLWEKFLHNTVFKEYTGVQGSYKQEKLGIIGYKRFAEPDFLLQKQGIVLDAKYKSHWGNTLKGKDWKYLRDDTYQIISYALIFDCTYCGVIFPVAAETTHDDAKDPLEVPISDYCQDRFFVRIPYYIPKPADNEESYRQAFKRSDQAMIDRLTALEEKVRQQKAERS